MPRLDLRRDEHSLDPLAHFKVLAVMTHPHDRAARERMLAPIQSATGLGNPRRSGTPNKHSIASLQPSTSRAVVAGALLLTRLQLYANGYAQGLNCAIPIVKDLLPKWMGDSAFHWHAEIHLGHRPTSRRKMLEAHRDYRAVAHLWATLIFALQNGRDDIWPDSLQSVPTFLSYSECILEMACKLPRQRGERDGDLRQRYAWIFVIPAELKRPVELKAMPLQSEQIEVLNKHGFRK